ncbi:MAG TPA: hypothetical protein VIZ18_18105, partial [Ktedonobacteraceae bacterium]
KYFVVERMLLAATLLAGAVGFVPAAFIIAPLIGLTLWFQAKLRDRHEFGRQLVPATSPEFGTTN